MLTNYKKKHIIGGSNTEIFTIKEYVLYKRQCILENMILSDTKEEYQYINNHHDKIFRKILDNKNEAIKIINRILGKEDNISVDDIEKYNSSYVSNKLKNSEADIVYKIKNQDIFFLIEHQTKIDYSMPYRILKYEVDLIESVLINKNYKNSNYRYPIVIPIVLYTGNKKWNAKLDLRKLQIKWNKYECQELSRYNILDINTLNDEELIEEDSFISKMILIEKSNTKKELEFNLNKIIERKNILTDEQLEIFITIIELVLKSQLGDDKANEFIYKLRKEEEKMLAVLEMLDKENKRTRNQGRAEGKKEEKIQIIKNMLKEKIPVDLICKVTGAKINQIEKIQNDIKIKKI